MTDKKFQKWLEDVNRTVKNKTFGMLDSEDLVDIDYLTLYEDGVPASEAAEEALIESGAGLLG